MKNKKRMGYVVALLLISILMIGCSSQEKQKDTSTHLNYGAAIYGTSLEPSNSYDSWELMRYGIGECLVRFGEDMSPEPWIAKSWKMDEDQLTWTFKIKDGVKFSDGSDCTATQVVESIERLFAKAQAGATAEVTTYFTYSDIYANEEDNTVTIVTERPIPDLPGCLAYPFFCIINVKAEESGLDVATSPVCTGPYAVESFDATQGAELKKNEYYWDGTPGYDTISLMVIQDSTTRAMALEAGDIDVASYITYADIDTFASDKENYEVHEIASARTAYMYMNQKSELGNEVLRQAIIMGTDIETTCNVTVGGSYIYGAGVLPNSLDYGTTDLTNPFQYNKEGAIKLLDDAGIVDTDGDGFRELNGEMIDIDLQAYENRSMDVFAEAIQVQMEEIGIKVTITLSDSNTVVSRQRSGQYDMACYNTLTTNSGDPAVFLAYWYSKSENNSSGFVNEAYDEIYEKLLVEFDIAKRKEYIAQLQQIIVDEAGVYVCGYYMSNTCNRTNVLNVKQVLADYYWITKDLKPSTN